MLIYIKIEDIFVKKKTIAFIAFGCSFLELENSESLEVFQDK